MFEGQGLNIARQPDNAANPRPDNRSGWLSGESPDVVDDYLLARDGRSSPQETGAPPTLTIRLWDPSLQLRYRAKPFVPPRPDGAQNRSPERAVAR